jgi:hypothetical protein
MSTKTLFTFVMFQTFCMASSGSACKPEFIRFFVKDAVSTGTIAHKVSEEYKQICSSATHTCCEMKDLNAVVENFKEGNDSVIKFAESFKHIYEYIQSLNEAKVARVYGKLHGENSDALSQNSEVISEVLQSLESYKSVKRSPVKSLDNVLVSYRKYYAGLPCEICSPQTFKEVEASPDSIKIQIPQSFKNYINAAEIYVAEARTLESFRPLFNALNKLTDGKTKQSGEQYFSDDVRGFFRNDNYYLLEKLDDCRLSINNVQEFNKKIEKDATCKLLLFTNSFIIFNRYRTLIVKLLRTVETILVELFEAELTEPIPKLDYKSSDFDFDFGQYNRFSNSGNPRVFEFSPLVDQDGFDVSQTLSPRIWYVDFNKKILV